MAAVWLGCCWVARQPFDVGRSPWSVGGGPGAPKAMRCRALLAARSPPRRGSRCLVVLPRTRGSGAAPHKAAKAASLCSRCGVGSAVINSWAAVSAPVKPPAARIGYADRTSIWALQLGGGRRELRPLGQHFGRGDRRPPMVGTGVSGRQRAIASINFNVVSPPVHCAPRPGRYQHGLDLVDHRGAVATAGGVRAARKPAVASSFGMASPGQPTRLRAAL